MKEQLLKMAESGKIPDFFIRFGIRHLCKKRLIQEQIDNAEEQQYRYQALINELRKSPIALATDTANEQHYEVPTEFYLLALGKNLKYSCSYYPPDCSLLDAAEEHMLNLYLSRAQIEDGMSILELGCGWGSLTLWMASHFPNAKIIGVSNSNTQRQYIMAECAKRNLHNVNILTEDVNTLSLDSTFDRVISIEMFEHMRNYKTLLKNISSWMKPKGKLFVHIFCHRFIHYPFEIIDEEDWMSKYFFTGGLMPSADTLLHFQDDLKLDARWLINGSHYEKTANDWLANMDANKQKIVPLFEEAYGKGQGKIWYNRWRIFFMACAELFAYNKGQEWLVGHYLFVKP
ncbi:MAG: cyclopropane-fatty-acyl-phospholipid synthase family protein [Bacteroidota bacterium]